MGGNVIFSTTTMIGNSINLHAPQFSLLSFYQAIYLFFISLGGPGGVSAFSPLFSDLAFFLKLIATFFCLLFLVALIYVVVKHHEFEKKEKEKELTERAGSQHSWVSERARAVAQQTAAVGPFGIAISPLGGEVRGSSSGTSSPDPVEESHAAAASVPVPIETQNGSAVANNTAGTEAIPSAVSDGALSIDDILNMARVGVAAGGEITRQNSTAGANASFVSAASNPSAEQIKDKQARTAKWQRVQDHSQSENPGDWRLAILEADILLDELLDMKHAHGDTISSKLKSMTEGDLPGLQKAWEAHLVRNQIAHEGSDFFLSQREARRIVALYESVLRDGGYM